MRVLVSDNLGEAGIQLFRMAEGIQVDVNVGLAPDALREIIGDYDALVIRSATKVTEELLAAATRLKVIGRAGIGLDNVDIPAATKRGIVVMNTPHRKRRDHRGARHRHDARPFAQYTPGHGLPAGGALGEKEASRARDLQQGAGG